MNISREEAKVQIKSILRTLVIVVIINMVFQNTKVSGNSMNPTIHDGDYILLNKIAVKNKIANRGDVVVFESNLIDEKTNEPKKLIKRVIGLPGERVQITNAFVYINGEEIEEPYLYGLFTDGEIDIVVPEDEVFVLGDNRFYSRDSRSTEVGTVHKDDMLGKAVFRYFPFDRITLLKNE